MKTMNLKSRVSCEALAASLLIFESLSDCKKFSPSKMHAYSAQEFSTIIDHIRLYPFAPGGNLSYFA
jgi:hypothetical protein